MKIFDCFSYLDEDLLLDIRLNILDNYVDYFVIVEGNKTWQNNFKGFKFNLEKFSKFKKKIVYLKVNSLPEGPNPWLRENYQRNYILKGLNNANDDDLIIISDLDEIPNPKKIKSFNVKKRFAVFNQKNFYYKINLQSQNHPYWLGSRICVKKFLKSPQWLRELKFKHRPFWRIDKIRMNNIITDGGWHFCNLKNAKDLLFKYQNLCETNDEYVFKQKIDQNHLSEAQINKKISNKLDIIGRNDSFKKIDLDSSYPKYILNNLDKFRKWID